MSALGEALVTKDREYVLKCKITVAVDAAVGDGVATYSLLLEAPEMSETLLEGQTFAEVLVAMNEFADWVTNLW